MTKQISKRMWSIKVPSISIFFVLSILFFSSCNNYPKNNIIPDFLDNTIKYKGQTITFEMFVDEDIFMDRGESLRDYVGKDVKFAAVGPNAHHLSMVIKIPEGLSVPNVDHNGRVIVTFICNEGNLRHGNIAKSIERL